MHVDVDRLLDELSTDELMDLHEQIEHELSRRDAAAEFASERDEEVD